MSKAKAKGKKKRDLQFSPSRASRRYVPVESVSAFVVSDSSFLAHGIVSNISARGACLITNTAIEEGEHIRVRFSTSNKNELFQAQARVVWAGEGMDPNMEIVGVMVGLAFEDVSPSFEDEILEILEQGTFHEVGAADRKKQPA